MVNGKGRVKLQFNNVSCHAFFGKKKLPSQRTGMNKNKSNKRNREKNNYTGEYALIAPVPVFLFLSVCLLWESKIFTAHQLFIKHKLYTSNIRDNINFT